MTRRVIKPEQRHDEARRAEAALRAVGLDHGLLHRVQATIGEVINGDHLGTVGLAGEQDAGIDRRIGDAAIDAAAQHHRAGAAIALGAAFLGAERALLQAQIVEQGQGRAEAAEPHLAPTPQKPDFVTHSALILFLNRFARGPSA